MYRLFALIPSKFWTQRFSGIDFYTLYILENWGCQVIAISCTYKNFLYSFWNITWFISIFKCFSKIFILKNRKTAKSNAIVIFFFWIWGICTMTVTSLEKLIFLIKNIFVMKKVFSKRGFLKTDDLRCSYASFSSFICSFTLQNCFKVLNWVVQKSKLLDDCLFTQIICEEILWVQR